MSIDELRLTLQSLDKDQNILNDIKHIQNVKRASWLTLQSLNKDKNILNTKTEHHDSCNDSGVLIARIFKGI